MSHECAVGTARPAATRRPSPVELLFGPIDRRLRAESDGTYTVTVTPPGSLRLPSRSINISYDELTGLYRWLNGKGTIQQCLPYLTADQREILLNGAPSL